MDHLNRDSIFSTGVPTKPLVLNHITNTNILVDVFQTDYSDCFRSYRVSRRDLLGPQTPAFLRILSVNDVMLLAVLFTLAVPSLPQFIDCFLTVNKKSIFCPGSYKSSNDNTNNTYYNNFSVSGGGAGCERGMLLAYYLGIEMSLTRVFLILLCFVAAVYLFVSGILRAHTEEVMAIRGLGMQVTSHNIFGWIISQRFVELKLIRSIVIHDAFFRCQAIFFLSVTVENETERLVIFEETLPRLEVLRHVLCGLRHILYEELEKGRTLTEMAGQCLDQLENGVTSDLKDTEEESNFMEHENSNFGVLETPERDTNFS